MKEMKGINGGGKIPKKAGATEQLNNLIKKKSAKELIKETVAENNLPKVKDFTPLIQKLDVKLVEIKHGYTAVKNEKGKVLTYVRDTSYGFSIETKNESGNWKISKVTKQSELDNWVKEIQTRLKAK